MGKSVEYYLSKGYDRKMAEYFASGRKRITKVVPRNDFTLVLSFDNGEIRLYDARPLLQAGTVFAPFREWNNFRRVYLGEDHSVCWDIDPNIDSNEVWTAFLFIDIEPENPAAKLQRDLLLLFLLLFHVFSQNQVNVLR